MSEIAIGFVSLGMRASPLDQVLRLAVDAGCEVMELNGRASVHHDLWAPPIDYAKIKGRFSQAGVSPSSLGGYCSFAQLSDDALAQEVAQFAAYCEVARRMGIPVVRAFAGDVVEGHTLDELYPRLVAGFTAVTDQVADWGVTIGIENHGRLINEGDQLLRLVEDVGSPILGLTIDTGNFCWAGHSIETAERSFEELAPLAVNVHVKDGRFVDGEFELLPAGRGDLDLVGLFEILGDAGYDGPVLSEYEGKDDFVKCTLESVAYLRGLRDALA